MFVGGRAFYSAETMVKLITKSLMTSSLTVMTSLLSNMTSLLLYFFVLVMKQSKLLQKENREFAVSVASGAL